MSSKTFKTRAIVLRKTRLAEKDLIVDMLDEAGMLVRGVAKGARRPGGSLAARLELFSTVDVLMAEGRSLDVVCEARLADMRPASLSLEQSSCAAPVAELLCMIAQPGLAQRRLFDMSRAAFAHIAAASDSPGCALSICAAGLWKIMAQSGFRPSFATCVRCGCGMQGSLDAMVAVSPLEGGAVCESCPNPADALIVSGPCIRWCEALIRSRFDEIAAYRMDPSASFEVLQVARAWIRAHTGRDLKSLDFLFAYGLS